jgi:undecaprenyl-diphosphatase
MIAMFRKIHDLDTLAFLWLHESKKVTYRQSVRWISRTGDGPLYIVTTLAMLLTGIVTLNDGFLSAALIAYAIELSLYLVLKNSVRRARPQAKINNYRAFITPSDTFSFPSGHTAAAFVFAFLLMQVNPLFALVAYPWACAIGASRVLLGVHFPSDIVAGATLGTVSAFIAVACL